MAPLDTTTLTVIMVSIAFAPPILYTIYIRNTERLNREPWGPLFSAFLFGAIFSILIAVFLTFLAFRNFETFVREYEYGPIGLTKEVLLVIVLAPVIEEFAKGLGVRMGRRQMREIEDGIIYGAAAGLGFSATENLLYEISSLQEDGGYQFLALGAVRSITSSFLHATTTGIVGYGIGRAILYNRPFIEVLPYYALAVLLHAAFNAVASFASIIGGVILVFIVSIGSIKWTLDRIRRFDRGAARVLVP